MADNENEPEAAEAQTPETSGRSKSGIGLLIGLAIFVMVATPATTILAFKVMTRKWLEKPHAPDTLPVEIALPPLQVNVADTNGTRYAQINIVVEVRNKKMKRLFSLQSNTSPRGKQRHIMATAICIVGEKSLESLLSADAKEKLGGELKTAFNDLLRGEAKGIVTDVYFDGYLIQ